MSTPAPSHGRSVESLAPAREVFERLLLERPGHGAALCAYQDGRPIIDVYGGPTYAPDSVQTVFSTGKGVTSIVVATLVQQGLLDYDAPIAKWWPEYAEAGKAATTLRQVLAHQAGQPAIDDDLSIEQWQDGTAAALLASRPPEWEPGSAHGYHAATFGVLVDEVVRRATGRTVGEVLRDDIAGPLGADVWIGLPEAVEPRVVQLRRPTAPSPDPDEGSLAERAFRRQPVPFAHLPSCNDRRYRAVGLPAVTAVAGAPGLARIYAACVSDVDGTRLLDSWTLGEATREQAAGHDVVADLFVRFAAGFQLPTPRVPMSGPAAFGHDGLAGSLAFGDPDLRLGFAFVSDWAPVSPGLDLAAQALVDAVVGCLHD
jgi:CubicO group peptidase (beta-lactamase class C family)